MEKFLIAILGIVLTTVIVVAESAVVGWVVMWAFKALHHDVSAVPPLGFDASFLAAFAILTLARTSRSSTGSND